MNTRALTLCVLPVLAYADILAPQCPSSQLLSDMTLARSGCVSGNEVFSNFSVTSFGLVAGISPLTVEFEFPLSISNGIEVEFSGGLTAMGGNSGTPAYEAISYDVSALDGAAIDGLMLGLGNVDAISQSGAGGSVFATEIVLGGTGDRNASWVVPGQSANITFGIPQSSVHVTDIVMLQAGPNGTVMIGGFSNRLLVNAEPGTVVLLGTALIVLMKLARRAVPS
jgi:hypothetical protein